MSQTEIYVSIAIGALMSAVWTGWRMAKLRIALADSNKRLAKYTQDKIGPDAPRVYINGFVESHELCDTKSVEVAFDLEGISEYVKYLMPQTVASQFPVGTAIRCTFEREE